MSRRPKPLSAAAFQKRNRAAIRQSLHDQLDGLVDKNIADLELALAHGLVIQVGCHVREDPALEQEPPKPKIEVVS